MRSIVAIISVLMLAIPVIAMADFSSGDETGMFEEGRFVYQILDSSSVRLIMYDDTDPVDTDVVIAATAEDPSDHHVYNVTEVSATFAHPDIHTITIGENVTDLTYADFEGEGIEAFYVAGGDTFGADNGVLFKKNGSEFHKLLRYPKGKTADSYNAPSTISEIGAGAFYGCRLTTLTLHDGLIKIDYSAFECCEELANLRTDTAEHTLPSTLSIIGSSAFSRCSKLTTLTLPEDLAYIGVSAFECTGLTQVNIPYGVDYIGDGAFRDCTSLVKFTSENYTYRADEKTGVLYRNDNNHKVLFTYPAAAPGTTYEIPEDCSTISPYAFTGCVNLTQVFLNETCTSVPDMAFYKCTSLTTMNLDGVMTIGSSAFGYCYNLKNVNFGNNVTYIDMFAFENTGLETVTIPSSVMYVDAGAFSSCQDLKEVTIPEESKVTLDEVIFGYDYALTDIYIQSDGVKLLTDSLTVSYSEFNKVTVDVHVVKGYSIPDDAANENTELNIIVIGERPYPWENWIGVFFCALVVIGILLAVREV